MSSVFIAKKMGNALAKYYDIPRATVQFLNSPINIININSEFITKESRIYLPSIMS